MEARVTVSESASAELSAASGTSGARKKFERTDYWKVESPSAGKHLHRGSPEASCIRLKRSRKGLPRGARRAKARWSAERRARQAELIRQWAPWRRSTGPKTEGGKAICAQNAVRHGLRSRARIHELQRVRYVLRLAAENIKAVKLLIQIRKSAERIKYKPNYAGALVRRPWRASGSRAILRPKSGGETCAHSKA